MSQNIFQSFEVRRTERGLKFDRWLNEVRNLLDGKDPEAQKMALAANQSFIRGLANPNHRPRDVQSELQKAVTPSLVHQDQLLQTFSLMYHNDEYIGIQLLPPVTVSKLSDKYAVYPKRERLAFPDDAISFRGKANEVNRNLTTANFSCSDYGLQDYVDLQTLDNEDSPLTEMLDSAETVMEGIAFNEEKRLATIIQTVGNYAGNTAAAASKWDGATGGSIVSDILAAKSAVWHGPTGATDMYGVTTLDNWNTCITNNPAIRDLFKYTGPSGIATTQQVANYFGLKDILIGMAREDTANEGQTASYARMWTTDFFGILTVARRPTKKSAHFGTTFRFKGDPYTTQWTDPSVGKRGGVYNKVTMSEDHKVVAGDAAYFISDVKT